MDYYQYYMQPVAVFPIGLRTVSVWGKRMSGGYDAAVPVAASEIESITALSGSVRGANGAALPGASIRIGSTAATADGSGLYNAFGMAPGTYSVTYSAPGYVDQTIDDVTVGLGSATIRDVQLVHEEPGHGDPTVLTITGPAIVKTTCGADRAIRGTLASGGAGVGGRTLVIEASTDGSTFTRKATTSTLANGSFSFTAAVKSKTAYRVRFEGDADYAASTSSAVTLVPTCSLGTPKAPATMKRAKTYTVYGSLLPKHSKGATVRIYRYRKVKGAWKRFGYVKAPVKAFGSASRYAVKMKLTTKGSWRLRAYAPADAGHTATWSRGYDYVKVK